MRKIFVSWLLTMLSTSASAVTLEQALTSGYTNNEELQIIRTDFLNEIEQFPRALAGFMPRVSANVDSTDSKVKRRSKTPLGPGETDFTTSDNLRYSRSITLEQPLFDGWSSMNSLKAAQFAFRASRGDYYAKEQDSFLKEINVYLDCVEAYEKYGISTGKKLKKIFEEKGSKDASEGHDSYEKSLRQRRRETNIILLNKLFYRYRGDLC